MPRHKNQEHTPVAYLSKDDSGALAIQWPHYCANCRSAKAKQDLSRCKEFTVQPIKKIVFDDGSEILGTPALIDISPEQL